MSSQERAPVEEYYPHFVNEENVEFDYVFEICRCGWESEVTNHPKSAEYELDGHHDYGHTPDCDLGKIRLVFEDGTSADIR